MALKSPRDALHHRLEKLGHMGATVDCWQVLASTEMHGHSRQMVGDNAEIGKIIVYVHD